MWKQWPPPEHSDRLARYERNKLLFKSGLNEVFSHWVDLRLIANRLYGKQVGETCAILLDYPRLMSLVAANLLVGEAPIISFKDKKLQAAWEEIVRDSSLKAELVELALATSYRGDGVLMARIRRDDKVVIECRSAATWFPELEGDHCREVTGHVFGWVRNCTGRKVLRIDEYRGGSVRRTAWELTSNNRVGVQIVGKEAEDLIGGIEIVPIGKLTEPPIEHIPNLRTDDEFYGESDYTPGLLTLFSGACNRISQIGDILDKHADPKMSGPPVDTPKGEVDASEMQYYVVHADESPPQYIVWDGKLESAETNLEGLLEQIYIQSEMSKVLVGWVSGARYDSARAFKLQFIPTLAKTQRKRTFTESPLVRVIRKAMALKLKTDLRNIPPPEVQWRDGLPSDPKEAAETEAIRVGAGLSSVERALQRLDECTQDEALEEIGRILKEKSSGGGDAAENNPVNTEEVDEDGR